MTKTVTDLATTAQAQFFEALEGAQEAVLEGVKLWRGTVSSLVPEELVKAVPLPKGEWVAKATSRVGLVRKAASRVVEA